MPSKSVILATILFAASAYAQQPNSYSVGKLLRVDSVQCESYNKDLPNHNAEPANLIAARAEAVCPEYVLFADGVAYRIVSRNIQHPAPLPIGELALFRLQSGKMLVRVPAFDNKEREYILVSVMPPQSSGDGSLIRLNHLQ